MVKKIKLPLFFLFLLVSINKLSSQNFQSVEEVNDHCAQLGFASNEDAELTVDRILDEIGLFRNFVLQECPNINNAVAKNIQTSSGEKVRYILYDNAFFDRIDQKAANDWASISILAHEIAHHLNGHSLNNKGSNHRFELEADFSSGFYLAKMGATLEQAQSAIQTLRYEKATATHPAKADRLKEIEKGWRKAYGLIKRVVDNPKEEVDEPKVIVVDKPTFYSGEDDIYLFEEDEEETNKYYGKAYDYYNAKNFGLAVPEFLKAYQYSKEPLYLYYSATSQYFSKDYLGALKRFQKLIDDGFTGGDEYFAINRETGKEEEFNTKKMMELSVKAGLSKNPRVNKNSKLLSMVKSIASCYLKLGQEKLALDYLNDAKKFDLDKYDLIIDEANIYLKMDNKVRFREKMEEALKYRPNNPDLYFNIGVIYQEVDNFYKARLYYGKAIEVGPTYSSAYLNTAAVILIADDSLVQKMNNLGATEADNKEYDRLVEKRNDMFREAIPYLEKAYDYGEEEAKNTLNNIYSMLNMDKRVD